MSQENKVYYFSSIGQTDVEVTDEFEKTAAEAAALPIGVKFPLQISYEMGSLVVMHKNLKSQIKDNFRNMIKTNWGDRLIHQDFGANLSPLVFELGTENVISEAVARIQKTTQKYMPFIELLTFESLGEPWEDGGADMVSIKIVYSIDGITGKMIEDVINIAAEIAG